MGSSFSDCTLEQHGRQYILVPALQNFEALRKILNSLTVLSYTLKSGGICNGHNNYDNHPLFLSSARGITYL